MSSVVRIMKKSVLILINIYIYIGKQKSQFSQNRI